MQTVGKSCRALQCTIHLTHSHCHPDLPVNKIDSSLVWHCAKSASSFLCRHALGLFTEKFSDNSLRGLANKINYLARCQAILKSVICANVFLPCNTQPKLRVSVNVIIYAKIKNRVQEVRTCSDGLSVLAHTQHKVWHHAKLFQNPRLQKLCIHFQLFDIQYEPLYYNVVCIVSKG